MIQKNTQHRMQKNNKNSEMMKLGPHGHAHTNPLPSLIFPPKTCRILDHNSWCFKFKKEPSVVPGRWFTIHDDEESGRQLAGWLKKWWWFSTATHFCRPSFLAVERKKERKTPKPIHSLLMIIDDDYDSGPGFSFFQFYNIQTTAVYLFLLLFVVSWIVRWFLSSVSCLLMLLIRRRMRLPQNTAMYVCMYVLVAAAAIIWGSSCSAGALPLLRHDDDHHHHLHRTPKASKQASRSGPSSSSPIFAPFLLIVLELMWSFLSRIPL